MAKAIGKDPFHRFRFAPRIGYDGKALGVNTLDVQPGKPWAGPGKVVIRAALKPEIIKLAQVRSPVPLIVGVYHITDELGKDGGASLNIVLSEVIPSKAQLVIDQFDAASSDILMVTFTMAYDRLTFLFGKADEVSLLDKMAAVV